MTQAPLGAPARRSGCAQSNTRCSRLAESREHEGAHMNLSRSMSLVLFAALLFAPVLAALAAAQPQAKPNILVIMGDDIGYWHISAYNRGQMGYRTPHLDQ